MSSSRETRTCRVSLHRITAALLAATIAVADTGLRARGPASVQSRLSPHETVSRTIDGAQIVVSYGRPSMRGRPIFGFLVPYGRVWCPGADEATTLESAKELFIGQMRLPRGPHTIWILPTAVDWTLIVSKEASGFHTAYHPERDLGRVLMQKRELPSSVERLRFALVASPRGGGAMVMSWERTEASVSFTTSVR